MCNQPSRLSPRESDDTAQLRKQLQEEKKKNKVLIRILLPPFPEKSVSTEGRENNQRVEEPAEYRAKGGQDNDKGGTEGDSCLETKDRRIGSQAAECPQ